LVKGEWLTKEFRRIMLNCLNDYRTSYVLQHSARQIYEFNGFSLQGVPYFPIELEPRVLLDYS